MQSQVDLHSRLSSDTLRDDDELSTSEDNHECFPPEISLGPKMRFHSPAPWEVDGDSPDDYRSDFHTLLSPRKPFPFSIAKTLETGRTSEDSLRFEGKPRKSFETTSSNVSYSRGALYALVRESMSTNSLVSTAGHGKPSLNLSPTKSPQTNTLLEPPPSACRSFTDPSFVRQRDSSHTPSLHRSTQFVDDLHHPFANPDLVASYLEDQSRGLNLSRVTTKSSIAASVASSAQIPLSRLSSSDMRRQSVASLTRSKLKKEISSPVDLRVDGITVRAWKDGRLPFPKNEAANSDDLTAPFSLISLEQARAQRLRNDSTRTAEPPLPNPFPSTQGNDSHGNRHPVTPLTIRRPRSTSIGAKIARQSVASTVGSMPKLTRQASPGSASVKDGLGGKAVKHKKSGFMKFFNSRTSDGTGYHQKDRRTPDVPVPELPRSPLLQQKPEIVDNPVSVRSVSPSPQQISPPPPVGVTAAVQSLAPTDDAPTPVPSLIVRAQSDSSSELDEQATLNDDTSATAASELPTLTLRPVSAVFSAKFTEHLLSPGPPTVNTSTFVSAANTKKSDSDTVVSESSESDKSVILRLQEEVLSERSKKLDYQRRQIELEERVTELEAELAGIRGPGKPSGRCPFCGGSMACVDSGVGRTWDSPGPKQGSSGLTRSRSRPRASTTTSPTRALS